MKRHPYIISLFAATILAIVVWLCVPKEYTAVTKLSDEYKEVDLVIGLHGLQSRLKNAISDANSCMNDMEVYCKVLDTEDFARSISRKQVAGRQMSYGEYLGERDTIESVQEHLNYNYSSKSATLIISFTDRDPLVAAMMLDSVTAQLQDIITRYRRTIVSADLQNAKKELDAAFIGHQKALKAFSDFVDAHINTSTQQVAQQQKLLEGESKMAYRTYEEASKQYARQLALLHRTYQSFAVIKPNTVPMKTNEHLIGYILSFTIIALLITYGLTHYRRLKDTAQFKIEWGDFFSPWSLTLVIWIGDLILYFLQGSLYPLGSKFLTCLSLWLITFIPCSLLAFWLSRNPSINQRPDHRKPIDVNMYAFYGFMFLSIVMTILYAKLIYSIVNQFDSENLLYNIRVLAVEHTDSYGLLSYTQGINIGLFLVAIWLYPRISKLTIFIIVFFNIILELAMMEKSGILIMILGALFVLYERGRIKVRTISLTFGFIIVLFFFFNMSKENTETEESMTFMDFFGMYVTSPMVAFERLRITIHDTFAPNTLNDVYPQLLRFGINVETIGRLQNFVFVPIPTNVYTIMQPFYNDFGCRGVAFFGLLYGSLFGYVYRKFYDGDDMYKCFYTFLVEVIIIQFYNENLLQVFHFVLEFVIVIVILTRLNQLFNFSISTKNVRYEYT